MLKIASFEFRYMLKSPQTLVTFGIFFLLTFFATVSDSVQIGGGGNVLVNAPYTILITLMILTVFAIFAVPAFIANSVLKDLDHKFDGIVFATPISKPAFLLGRFLGSFAALLLAFSGSAFGLLIGSLWPTVDPETVAPTNLAHYISVLTLYVGPVLLSASMIIYALAVATRSVMYTYLASMGLLVAYFISRTILSGPEYADMTALSDPFMISTLLEATRYWTAADRNAMLPAFEGVMLHNRLIWLGVTLALTALAYRLFSFRTPAKIKAEKAAKSQKAEAAYQPLDERPLPTFGFGASLAAFRLRTAFEVTSVFKSLPFLVIMGFSLFLLITSLITRNVGYGVDAYPVTRLMIEASTGGLSLALLVVMIFYSADIVWRERSTGMHEIIDAVPVPNWVFVASKLVAMFGVVLSILLMGVLSALAVQVISGFGAQEISLYLHRGLFYPAVNYMLLAILAIFVQVVSKNRFIGMMIMVVFMIGTITLNQLGFEHPLYQYASNIPTPITDMNAGGRFIGFSYWLVAYWGAFAALLLIASYLLWSRGTLQPVKLRLGSMIPSMGTPMRAVAAAAVAAFIGTGSFIFYNTNILNDYVTSDDLEDLAVLYEETYRQYEDLPQPRIVDVAINVDLYPYERKVLTAGTHVLENKTTSPIETIHLVFPGQVEVDLVDLDGASTESIDDTFNYHILALESPMQPGEKRTLRFETRIEQQGFLHMRDNVSLVANGTFINNFDIAPHVGFSPALMLQDRNTRRRRGLEPLPRTPDLDDESQFSNNYIRQDSDFVTFKTTVSTVEGQIAVAPGYLQRDWVSEGRHHFEYDMDAPILNFYSYLSADYDVVRDSLGDTAIEVYHHQPHGYNVDRMIEAVKDSITLFSEAFSPYQHKQLRILEFPSYRTFAQAFPNTVPYSEGIGFIANVTGEDEIDLPYYVTAHEVAHQWWAHQVMPANTQGGTLIVETLAQYGALLVMEQEYGKDKIRKFLKYELDRYLSSRAGDPEGELPLYRVENQQYIHYRKGAVIMYALKDYLGADVVNRALAKLVTERGFTSTPYARSVDLLRLLKEEAGPEHHGLITDFLEKITLYDVTAGRAVMTADEAGHTLTFDVETAKYYADAEGAETEAIFDIPVDIGVFRKNPGDEDFSSEDVLYLAKTTVENGKVTLTLPVESSALFVGIDPYNKLIDRNSDDNIVRIEMAEPDAAPNSGGATSR